MLGGTVILCFITFRVVGAIVVGHLSDTQIAYIATEIVELGIITAIFWKADGCVSLRHNKNRGSLPET